MTTSEPQLPSDSPSGKEGCPGEVFPPTIIIVHPRERRSKCSVEPLRGRDGFHFFTFPEPVTLPLKNYIRLGIGGDVLTEADAESGLLVLDGTWRLAQRMEPFYKDMPVRTLPPIQTAYPRKSKIFDDPDGGLATIEAVYAALRIMKRPVDSLLDSYHWKEQFLELNHWN
ncbi:MAG: DTW domain-containing protein [Planctomycetaceae bacterium]|nr:DTW domain-containing protein [Planctomycetaceae bacterium]